MLEQFAAYARDGGPIVLILAAMSVYSLALIVLKVLELSGVLAGGAARTGAVQDWRANRLAEARGRIAAGRTPADRVLGYAMAELQLEPDRAVLELEIERRGNEELMRMRRFLRTLEVIAMVSPLMGLLGTVLGMIQSFQELELAEGSANAAVLAGGIWQALLTTAMGLIVAIPAAIAANLLSARVDRAAHGIEDAVAALYAADHARRA